jgi:hypothetical protein
MRSVLSTVIVSIFFMTEGLTQSIITAFDFDKNSASMLHNPSYDIHEKYFINLPGAISLGAGSSGASYYDVMHGNDEPAIQDLRNLAFQLGGNESVELNQKTHFLYAGFKGRNDNLYTFGFYQELNLFSTIPQEMAVLFFEGNTQQGKQYDIDGFSLYSDLTGVYHFGINKKLSEEERIGVRFKLYSSVYDVRTSKNKGVIHNTQGTNGIVKHDLQNAELGVNSSQLYYEEVPEIDEKWILNKLLFSGSKGFGIDIGYTKYMNEQWYYSVSILDLGFVYNNKNIKNYSITGEHIGGGTTESFDEENPENYWQSLEEDFSENVAYQENSDGYLSIRPVNVHFFTKKSFGERRVDLCDYTAQNEWENPYKNAVGGLVSFYKRNEFFYPSASVFYERYFGDVLSTRISYAAHKYSYSDIGIALSLKLWKININAAAQNVLELGNVTKTKYVNGSFGISVLF